MLWAHAYLFFLNCDYRFHSHYLVLPYIKKKKSSLIPVSVVGVTVLHAFPNIFQTKHNHLFILSVVEMSELKVSRNIPLSYTVKFSKGRQRWFLHCRLPEVCVFTRNDIKEEKGSFPKAALCDHIWEHTNRLTLPSGPFSTAAILGLQR